MYIERRSGVAGGNSVVFIGFVGAKVIVKKQRGPKGGLFHDDSLSMLRTE